MKYFKLTNVIIAVVLLGIGMLMGKLLFTGPSSTEEEVHDHSEESGTWTCSMHPQVKQSGPGQCPFCGMDLVPLASLETELSISEISMTESAMKIADIRTMKVSTARADKVLILNGKIRPDERNIYSVPAHFRGSVEKLFVDFTGQSISTNQKLATIYSPDLVLAQKELFEAEKLKESNPEYYQSAVRKLKLWELTDGQIESILEAREPQYYFDILAPQPGIVMERMVSEGDHVTEGQVLYKMTDLRKVWAIFEVYESDLSWVKIGSEIEFSTSSLPGKSFRALVNFISPVVNQANRTVGVRAELQNPGLTLKPDMFVEGRLISKSSGGDQLSIPKSAVLWTGKRAVVYVKKQGTTEPVFEFREVTLGPESNDSYIVVDGLSEGEVIAVNGVFKIDAAAQLQGKSSMMMPEGGAKPTGHNHFQGEEMGIEVQKATNSSQIGVNQSDKTFEADENFKNQLLKIYASYQPLREAFIDSDHEAAKKAANEVLKAINGVDMKLVKGNAHLEWIADFAVLKGATNAIIEIDEIESGRSAFSPLSDQLYETLTKFEVTTGGFRLYCPMAFDNQGAFWLSNSDEILNPYFGEAMLRCGNVEEKM